MGLRDALRVVSELETERVIGRYAICGAIAAFYYVEPAATDDIDVLINFEPAQGTAQGLVTLDPVLGALKAKGYTTFRNEGLLVEGFPVQFIPAADRLDADALERAMLVALPFPAGPIQLRILTAEDLACMAVRLGRPKDVARLSTFVMEEALDRAIMVDRLNQYGLVEKWRSIAQRAALPPSWMLL